MEIMEIMEIMGIMGMVVNKQKVGNKKGGVNPRPERAF
jgi:hypothetical protein